MRRTERDVAMFVWGVSAGLLIAFLVYGMGNC